MALYFLLIGWRGLIKVDLSFTLLLEIRAKHVLAGAPWVPSWSYARDNQLFPLHALPVSCFRSTCHPIITTADGAFLVIFSRQILKRVSRIFHFHAQKNHPQYWFLVPLMVSVVSLASELVLLHFCI